MRLKDKIAIVTGGGSGIGRATCQRFAKEPATVNVADAAACDALVADVVKKHGRLDILINNAGITRDAAMKKMVHDQWDAVIAVNLTGTYNMCRAAINAMIEKNAGRIVNTASIAVWGNFGQANYAASKAGVIGLTRTMALETAKHKITVNAIAPGAVDTAMTAAIPPEVKERMIKGIPAQRMAQPDEVAALHTFLASDEAAYITGQVIFICGGLSIGA